MSHTCFRGAPGRYRRDNWGLSGCSRIRPAGLRTKWLLVRIPLQSLKLLPVIYCDYLLKKDRMDEKQVVFDQLTLSNFEKWSLSELNIFYNNSVYNEQQ